MNYLQAIGYLFERLPVFHRVGAAAYRADLGNILVLCKALNDPHRQFRSIHIGGTNGKGSVSHMLSAVLQTAGYRTGLYTSPHLKDFRERIRIDGKMIPKSEVVRFVAAQKALIEELSPSFFEVTVAMALWYFAEKKVDIAVIEVGLGGRLDSTNIITPILSVITNIGFDHVHILGDSLEKIAAEKAGIIKKAVPVVIGEHHPETAPVFREKADAVNSPISFASLDWALPAVEPSQENPGITASGQPSSGKSSQEKYPGGLLELDLRSGKYGKRYRLKLDLTAAYQKKNIKTVLSAVEQLRLAGLEITGTHLEKALGQVKQLTGFAGRWQIIGRQPLVVCDTGHNQDGIRAVLEQLKATPYRRLHMVFGMVNDKEVDKILQMLPAEACFYFCKADVPRGLDANILREMALGKGLRGESYSSVREALKAAKDAAGPADLIFVGGSTFVVAEAL